MNDIKELVIVSGKGGTGKTSLVAAMAGLADNTVLADCDVDAADLHLVLEPSVRRQEAFRSGHEAVIRDADCIGCGACLARCRFDAVERLSGADGAHRFRIDPFACEGCGVCVRVCPVGAIDFPEKTCGTWFVSDTRFGPMVHARLGVAEENSGRLVTLVRKQARDVAEAEGRALLIVDGSPGIGCPVIASITGASMVLVVTEPTRSGLHDLDRVLQLAAHFKIPAAVCINKHDINPEMATALEAHCREAGVDVLGTVRYDRAVTESMVRKQTVVEFGANSIAEDIRSLWSAVRDHLATVEARSSGTILG
jgi:MinD superfamily P-loop ATPase